ncbi:glycosyltransferase [Pedobacter aquatilis]|uniref:glycosyltransferase n=1 Tax=Pedobacter aquatilis TaxID=351343 RepID=UPI00293015D6|nr:glycosyltransferase [Pedobacter aquatilis]
MFDFISVIIPTYNPKEHIFIRTLDALKAQTLARSNWEIIIIDNNSAEKITTDLFWQQNSKIIFEPRQGLSYARLNGFSQAKGELILMLDDDNILDRNYLSNCLNIFNENMTLGAIGGKSLPSFEVEPPYWINEFYGNLALRDLGDVELVEFWENKYPNCAPIGAGMAIKKIALESYMENNLQNKAIIADRTGYSLSSGGDNDIVIEILKSGWSVGYFPRLELTHIIPKGRLQFSYFARLVNDTNKSWVQLLEKHKINPWNKIPGWTLPFRKVKSWFKVAAWKSKINYLKWKATCGYYDGLIK